MDFADNKRDTDGPETVRVCCFHSYRKRYVRTISIGRLLLAAPPSNYSHFLVPVNLPKIYNHDIFSAESLNGLDEGI